MITTCIDCGCSKRSSWETQSFQCDNCHENLVTRLSKIAPKKEFVSKRDRITKLLKEGKAIKEIAKETDSHIAYVYETRRELAK